MIRVRGAKTTAVLAMGAGVIVGVGTALGANSISFADSNSNPAVSNEISESTSAEPSGVTTPDVLLSCRDLAKINPATEVEWTDTVLNPETGIIEAHGNEGSFEVDSTDPSCQGISPVVDQLVSGVVDSYQDSLTTRCPEYIEMLDPDSPLLTTLTSSADPGGELVTKLGKSVTKKLKYNPGSAVAAAARAKAGPSVVRAIAQLRKGTSKVGQDELDRQALT